MNSKSLNKAVLLHSCCAPCSSAILEWMLANEYKPTIFYCNPNIYPEEEYLIRKNEITKYAQKLGVDIIDDDYNHEAWQCRIHGMEDEPERGARCLECFKIRLLRTAQKCAELGIPQFTTTLASSRWKSLEQINEAGRWAAECVNKELRDLGNKGIRNLEDKELRNLGNKEISFWDRNWRKGGLQERRNQLLKENGFYNQLYCGCEFSKQAMEEKFAERK